MKPESLKTGLTPPEKYCGYVEPFTIEKPITHKPTDILDKPHIPENFSASPDSLDKKPIFSGLFAGRVLFLCLIVVVPVMAEAGFLTAISKVLGTKMASADVEVGPEAFSNSQTMNLLEVPQGRVLSEIVISQNALQTEDGPTGTSADLEKKQTSQQISIYKVKPGDTLSGIADMFDVSVSTILWANEIKGKTISVGQTLTILPIAGVQVTVGKGDTLKSIAKKYGGDVDEITAYNGIEGALAIGQKIIIPDGEISTPTPTKAKSSGVKGTIGSVIQNIAGFFSSPLPLARLTQGLHGHNGVDLGAPEGTAIYAAADGDVIVSKSSGYNGGYGEYVVLNHSNGTQTLYAHMSQVAVGVGARVQKGAVIGRVGSTGKSTGDHLHFEVRGATNPFTR